MQNADELIEQDSTLDPDPTLEPFYILVALEIGDPEQPRWLENNHKKLYAMWHEYQKNTRCKKYLGATVALQYMLWYERYRPTIDTQLKTHHSRHTNGAEAPQTTKAYCTLDGRDQTPAREVDDETSADSD